MSDYVWADNGVELVNASKGSPRHLHMPLLFGIIPDVRLKTCTSGTGSVLLPQLCRTGATQWICPQLLPVRGSVLQASCRAGRGAEGASILHSRVLFGMANRQDESGHVRQVRRSSHPSDHCNAGPRPCTASGRSCAPHGRGQAQQRSVESSRSAQSIGSHALSHGRYAR